MATPAKKAPAASPKAAAAPPAAPPKVAAVPPAAPSKAAAASPGATPERRRPGRPPSKPPAPPLESRGVVDTPSDADHRLELVYGDPMVFKALFSYFKNIKAREVHLRCAPQGLTFFARDHAKISRVVAHVAGEHVNHYYCEDTFWLGLNRELVEKLFAAIDKTFYKMMIAHCVDDPDTLSIIYRDTEVDKECRYKATLSAYAPDDELYEAERHLGAQALATAFPVEFTLTAKQFKKTVSDVAAYSETLTIEKLGAAPLQFTYAKAGMAYSETYRDPDKISLRSAVPADAAFRCTVRVANVKSLAASMVTDDVRVHCREEGDLLFRSAIDAKALVVSTLTRLA
jgi:hypothetical protein